MATEWLDVRQLKSDGADHDFTSETNLRKYVRFLRLNGSKISRDELEEMQMWLQQNSDELPGELYDRDGLPRFQKAEYPMSWATPKNQGSNNNLNINGYNETGEMRSTANSNMADAVLQDTTGMYYTAELQYNRSIGSVANEIGKSIKDPEQRAAYKALGSTIPAIRSLVKLKRGKLYAEHAERQAKRLRWLGMEEYDAVAKADAHLRTGAKLDKAASNAQPLPPLERLCALLSYDSETGVFTRLVKAGRAKAGDVVALDKDGRLRIDGTMYYASRVAVLMHTGDDPDNKTVSVLNGDKRDVRWSNLEVQAHAMKASSTSIRRKRVDGEDKFDSVVKLNGKAITIGTYKTAVQAAAARGLFKRSLEMGLFYKSP
jgi:hypothetical protein